MGLLWAFETSQRFVDSSILHGAALPPAGVGVLVRGGGGAGVRAHDQVQLGVGGLP